MNCFFNNRTCTSGKLTSCRHSAEEVLDFEGRSKIEDKISKLCDEKCQTMRSYASTQIEELRNRATLTLSIQEDSLKAEIKAVSKLISGFDTIGEQLNDEASSQQLEDFQGQVIDYIEASESKLSQQEKESIDTKKLKETVKKGGKVSKIRNLVKTGFLKEKGRKISLKDKIHEKKVLFKKKIGQLTNQMKAVGTSENIAKASKAVGGAVTAVGKFTSARNPDGSIDEKKVISGGLDIVDGIAAFAPPPASAVTGTVTSLFNLFTGGGGPSIQQVIQDEFKKQKKFIEEQFKKQETVMKEMMTETELESIKAKGLGVLDAMLSRYEFIAAYEGIGTCLKDEAIAEITERVEYFMDQSDAFAVKHTFDSICPSVLADEKALESQKVCGFLLYTYLVIEEKRREILTVMTSLLSTTEEFDELNYGYFNVQDHQDKAIKRWASKVLDVTRTYCGLFVYHANDIWQGLELEKIQSLIDKVAPHVKNQADKCAKSVKTSGTKPTGKDITLKQCTLDGYKIEGEDLGKSKETKDAAMCQVRCFHENQCNYWTFRKSDKHCFLRSKLKKAVKSSDFQSGAKECFDNKEQELKNNSTSFFIKLVTYNHKFVFFRTLFELWHQLFRK